MTEDEFLIEMAYLLIAILCLIPGETLGKYAEANIKLKFTDYLLSCNKTPGHLIISEAVNYLICFAAVVLMSAIYTVYSYFVTGGVIDAAAFKLSITLMLLAYTVNWIGLPLIIKLKSEEKAGVTIGLTVGVIILPLSIAFGNSSTTSEGAEFLESLGSGLMNFYNSPWFFPVYIAVLAAICLLVYYISIRIIKRGDVC